MATTLRLLLRRLSTASPSSILSPSNPTTILSSKQKTAAAFSLLKSPSITSNPNQILSIANAASVSPSASPLDRAALNLAASHLSSSPSTLRSLLSSLPPSPKNTCHVIALFGRANLLDDALSTFRSHNPSISTLNSLIFAAVLAKNPDAASRFFRELPESYNLSPDVETYNVLIKSFAESGSTRSFYSLLDEIGKRGIKPNATTFCNALTGFYREGKLDEVEKVLEVMKKWGCNPGALAVYNVRILSLCKMKRTKEAMELFMEMGRKGLKANWVAYGNLIVGLCKEGELEEAKRVYGLMKGRRLGGESWLYFSLLHYLCVGGDFEAGLGVYEDAMVKNWVPKSVTMKMLVEGLVKEGKVEEAKKIVGTMKEKFPNNSEMWKEVEDGFPQ